VEVEGDEVVDEVEEVKVEDGEVVLEMVEDVDLDDALDVLSFGVGVGLGLEPLGREKRILDIMPNCLSWKF